MKFLVIMKRAGLGCRIILLEGHLWHVAKPTKGVNKVLIRLEKPSVAMLRRLFRLNLKFTQFYFLFCGILLSGNFNRIRFRLFL